MLTFPSARRGRRLWRGLLAAALAACALPAAASATTVSIDNNGTLRYFDGRGATNNLFAREDASAIFITDTARVDPVSFAPGSIARLCTRVNTSTVRCPFDAGPVTIKRFSARMGDGNDSARVHVLSVPVEIEGQGGEDQYIGGGSSTLSRLRFRGGSGSDTAFYGPSAVGVRLSNDGVANDGRIGLDDDNIDRDVERLVGSPFADDLTDASAGGSALRGGLGDDVLRAGAGTTVFDMGPSADGADQLINGSGRSVIDYDQRTRPVNATVDFGGRDDGEPGEGDEIVGRHESVEGGQAGDTIHAPRGSLAPYVFSGHGGNDTINGASGNDTVFGGAGGDTITTFGGDDRIVTSDGVIDIVDCGTGVDTVELAAGGFIHVSCENRNVGVLRLAPRMLSAAAGETARLRLGWRHPRGWRQLRRVELRVYRGDARVGEVAISPQRGRITDGGAVRLVRRATRLTREGKTVSALIALRLDPALAGRLRLEVQAVDVRGGRQLERDAGAIRLAK